MPAASGITRSRSIEETPCRREREAKPKHDTPSPEPGDSASVSAAKLVAEFGGQGLGAEPVGGGEGCLARLPLRLVEIGGRAQPTEHGHRLLEGVLGPGLDRLRPSLAVVGTVVPEPLGPQCGANGITDPARWTEIGQGEPFVEPVSAHISSVMNGMNGCSSL